MRFYKITLLWCIILFLFLGDIFVFASGGQEGTPNIKNYSVGTGGQSGIYYPFGGAIAKLWSEHVKSINVKAEVTAASVENTIKVASGAMIAGFAQANVVEQAYNGTGKFDSRLPVNILVTLYPNLLHIILPKNTKIKRLADLTGAKVSLGAPASGTAVTAENVLKANGVAVDDIDARYLNYSETTNAIANGQIDAGFIVGGLGVGAVTELALTKDIVLLSLSNQEISSFLEAQPIYSKVEVPAGVYNKVGAFTTVAIWNTLVVRQDMDENLAYKLAKTIYENNDYLVRVVKSAQYTVPKNSYQVDTVPLHPGTIRYLNEIKTQE